MTTITAIVPDSDHAANLDVFVSYSRRNLEFVSRLCDALKQHQRSLWVDWQDIPPNADWRREIRTGIVNAHTFLFILSPDAIASVECQKELEYAIQQHKRLMPIVCQTVKDDQVHPALAALNWIFFREQDDFDRSLKTLLQALDADLDYIQAHTRLLIRANDWQQHHCDRSLLLSGKSLEAIEQWLVQGADKTPRPSQLQLEYVAASRLAEKNRQRSLLTGVSVALVGISALGLFAFQQYRTAEKNRKLAVTGEIRALSASSNAQFTIHQEFQALIDGLRAARLLKQANWIDLDTQLDVMSMLGKAVYHIKERNRLEGHTRWVRRVRFSPDGTVIASASGDNTIKLWQTDGRLLQTLKGHTDGVFDLSFSPDGEILASASLDHTVKLWKLDGTQIATLKGHAGKVRAISFSPDGTQVASAGDDRTIRLWQRDGKLIATLKGHQGEVFGVS
ncbi:toll/interleukin-1 receptor domain-containing protein, partial [Phormidesmis sp. 146-20]